MDFFCFYATREWLEARVPAEDRARLRPYVTRAPPHRERRARVAGDEEDPLVVSPRAWSCWPSPPQVNMQPATHCRTTREGGNLCMPEVSRTLGAAVAPRV